MGELQQRNYRKHNLNVIEMSIKDIDTSDLLDELNLRCVDVRTIREFSMTEINNEITRRRMEAEQAEIEAQADADRAEAESDAKAQAEAEAIAEDNARADQERAEAELQAESMQAEYEAEMAQR